jgi:protocatechuate 3,4-dioxygenase beta subunit
MGNTSIITRIHSIRWGTEATLLVVCVTLLSQLLVASFSVWGSDNTSLDLDKIKRTEAISGDDLIDPAEQAKFLLRGRVIDVCGTPAVGVEVWAAARFQRPPLRATTHTDASGTFALKLAPLTEPAYWEFRSASGTRGGEAGIVLASPQAAPELEIPLQPRGIVKGRVLDMSSKTEIVGAQLFLDDGRILKSDSEGRFTITGLSLRNHSLVVASLEHERMLVQFDSTMNESLLLDVYVPRGGIVKGRVVDEAGNPIRGAYVTVPISGDPLALNGFETTADDNGEFEWRGHPLGRDFRLSASSVKRPRLLKTLEFAGRSELPVETTVFTLPFETKVDRPATNHRADPGKFVEASRGAGGIKGRVVDRDGRPVRTFRVTIHFPRTREAGNRLVPFYASYEDVGISFTNDDGEFLLSNLASAADYRLHVITSDLREGTVDAVRSSSLGELARKDKAAIRISVR